MWALFWVPDAWLQYVVHAFFVSALTATVVGFFASKIPFISQYGQLIKTIGIIGLIVGVYFEGGYQTEKSWRDRVAELQAKVAIAEQKSAEANVKLEAKVKEKIKTIKEVQYVNREIIKEKRVEIDAECRVPDVAIRLHNDASKNVVSESSRGPKASVSGTERSLPPGPPVK